MRAFMADRDQPEPNYGYNLQGLASSVCSECNQGLELTIGLAEAKPGAWLAGVIGLTVSAGFGVAMFGVSDISCSLPRFRRIQNNRCDFHHNLACGTYEWLLPVLLVSRGRFCKFGLATRISVAISCWLLSLASLSVFSLVTG